MKTKKLTAVEELTILNLIDIANAEYVDCGAARFLIQPYENSNLDLFLKSIGLNNNETPFIIKVSMGPGGLAQTQAEIKTYLENDDIRHFLADIYAYGFFIEIMEKVDTQFYDYNFFRRNGNDIDCDTFEEDLVDEDVYGFLIKNIQEKYDFDRDYIIEICLQGFYAFTELQEIFGYTSDVGQIGTDLTHSTPKAYDYGFFYDIDCSSQTSDMDGEDYEGVYEYYIPELASGLQFAIDDNNFDGNDKQCYQIIAKAESIFFEQAGEYDDEEDDLYDHDEIYYEVYKEADSDFNEYFESEKEAMMCAKEFPITDKAYVVRGCYPADYYGNSLGYRDEETIWSYNEMEDTCYWEEENHNSEDMKDTSFWEK